MSAVTLLFPEKCFAYLRITRVASTSIQNALAAWVGLPPCNPWTRTWRAAVPIYKTEATRGYYRVAFVRDPRARLYGVWLKHWVHDPEHRHFWTRRRFGSFEEFAWAVVETTWDKGLDEHLKPQTNFVLPGGVLAADFVGRFERLGDDWRRLQLMFGLPDLPHDNRIEHPPFQNVFSRELWAAVTQRYVSDIRAFDYPERRRV